MGSGNLVERLKAPGGMLIIKVNGCGKTIRQVAVPLLAVSERDRLPLTAKAQWLYPAGV